MAKEIVLTIVAFDEAEALALHECLEPAGDHTPFRGGDRGAYQIWYYTYLYIHTHIYGTFSFVALSRFRPFPPLPSWFLGLGLGFPGLGLGSPSLGLGSPSPGLGTPSLGLRTQSLGLGPRPNDHRVGERAGLHICLYKPTNEKVPYIYIYIYIYKYLHVHIHSNYHGEAAHNVAG